MSDEQVKEFVTPVISLTPLAVVGGAAPEECGVDNVVRTAETPLPRFIEFQSCTRVDGNDEHTTFDIAFIVQTPGFPDSTGVVVRRVMVNNSTLAAEVGKQPYVHIESVEDKRANESTAKRLRELAGIPHRGNFV